MPEKERRSTVRRSDDLPRKMAIQVAADPAPRHAVTLWRMRSATGDNQASCSVADTDAAGCDVLVVFAKGLGVPEHFSDLHSAVRHSMDIAGRLAVQGWVQIDLSDR